MATIHGKGASLLLDQYDLSVYFREVSIRRSKDLARSETFGDNNYEFTEGLRAGTVTATGLFDGAVAASDAALSGVFGAAADKAIWAGVDGDALNKVIYIGAVQTAEYSAPTQVTDMVSVAGTFQTAAAESLERARSLAALASRTGSGSGSSVDNTDPTTDGGMTQFHMTAGAAAGQTVKVQHSVDNLAWDDLVTITTGASAEAQRVAVAAGTTVRRYLRADWALGANNITFALAFARR